MTTGIAAIILAAGYSSRMGEFKPLLPFGDVTALERVVSLFRDAGVADVRVVVGHRAAELEPLLGRLHARAILNQQFQEGMFSSVCAGVRSLEDDIAAFFLTPVDIPLVRPETVAALLKAFIQNPAAILYPVFNGKRGHPPLIDARLCGEILAWCGDGGLKSFLALHEDAARDVETGDDCILHDMDTPQEYEKLRRLHRKRETPSEEECERLLTDRFRVEGPVIEHSRAVARLALVIARRLNLFGCGLDTDLIAAASLLHDVAKGGRAHAVEGARKLVEMGFGEIARIVAMHMDIQVADDSTLREEDILYLADKMTSGVRYVTLEERFSSRLEMFRDVPEARVAVKRRWENAKDVQQRIEVRLGCSLYEVMREDGLL